MSENEDDKWYRIIENLILGLNANNWKIIIKTNAITNNNKESETQTTTIYDLIFSKIWINLKKKQDADISFKK